MSDVELYSLFFIKYYFCATYASDNGNNNNEQLLKKFKSRVKEMEKAYAFFALSE